MSDPVLEAIVDAVVAGVGGSDGWLLAVHADELEVVAASGPAAVGFRGLTVPAHVGTAGFVVGSGQPMAVALRADDARATSGLTAMLPRVPASVISVPCDSAAGVIGALEVVDKIDGGMFTFDDVELATLLAGIAGVVLQTRVDTAPVRTPDELARDLGRLADGDPARYQTIARLLSVLVADE